MRVVASLVAVELTVCIGAVVAAAPDGEIVWRSSAVFPERFATLVAEPDVRLHVNQPVEAQADDVDGDDADGDDDRPVRLLLYALPNGNTLEQTLGCQPAEGRHWRYNIQHIAAQTRMLRELLPAERIVLLGAEAKGLSWPAWRRDHEGANERIAELLADWRVRFAAPDARVTLAAHSGGGSFLWGVLEAGEIPEWVDRIVFLDANYSFDADKHAEKFRRWIEGAPRRQLVAVAYDDREITLDGKKVVGPTGGTYRATGRMRDAFMEYWPMRASGFGTVVYQGNGYALLVHPNPDNKILHTVLVGELNGLVLAQLHGQEVKGWRGLAAPHRAYARWIQPEPYPAE
ncbi:hypothetical protein Mal64_12270 [Pseudobythopirellula maris]|uniref:Alpha/beta hydrolase family protein n=2 Tax=Pseudobythopirellula maris TaxID=2527991 RepID=A0A5C5ZUB5_9BACT|nr:hypothetical protein Mal64_12270 [Pseudobythopirellula maris]